MDVRRMQFIASFISQWDFVFAYERLSIDDSVDVAHADFSR